MNDLELLKEQLTETNTLLAQISQVTGYLQERHSVLTADIQAAEEQAAAHAAALLAAEQQAAAAEQAKWEAQKALDALQQQQLDALQSQVDSIDPPAQDITTIVNNLVEQVNKLKEGGTSTPVIKNTSTFGRRFIS